MQDIGPLLLSLIRFIFISIGYILALPVAIAKAIIHHTDFFSNKIVSDIYPMGTTLGEVKIDNGKAFVPKSPCCTALIKAKFENGEPQYFYCSSCNHIVTKEEIEKQRFDN